MQDLLEFFDKEASPNMITEPNSGGPRHEELEGVWSHFPVEIAIPKNLQPKCKHFTGTDSIS